MTGPQAAPATSVLLVDDQQVVRSGLRLLLSTDSARSVVEVVGEAANGAAAVEEARRTTPDVVLMDLAMPVMDGVEATRRIVADRPATRVLVLTTFDADENVLAALDAGASGFLLKDVTADQLVESIGVVARGDAVLAPRATKLVLERFGDRRAAPAQGSGSQAHVPALTERERQVLALVARGLSNTEISDRLGIGVSTVKTHVGAVLLKLGLRDRVQAVVWWYDHYGPDRSA